MSKRRFRLPSPALVISMIALSLVLGGTAFAAAASHGDKKADTKLVKKLAPTLSVKHAKTADNATNATNADTAANATALQGKAASAFAPSAIEAAHVVGAAGEPAFQNGWHAPGFPGDEGLSFYKDPWGIVHIQGSTSNSGSTSTVFTLPAGYRPAKNLYLAVYGAGGSIAFIQITDTGDVNPFGGSTTFLGLTNVTFRAGL